MLLLLLLCAQGFADAHEVDPATLEAIHKEVATPYKYGVVIPEQDGKKVDSPSVFRHGDAWYMLYIAFDGDGYETWLAKSDDLLRRAGSWHSAKAPGMHGRWRAMWPCRTGPGAAVMNCSRTTASTG